MTNFNILCALFWLSTPNNSFTQFNYLQLIFQLYFSLTKKNFSFTACVTRQSRYVYMLFELKIQFYTVLRRLRINVNSKMISQFTLTKKRAFGVKKILSRRRFTDDPQQVKTRANQYFWACVHSDAKIFTNIFFGGSL